MKQFARLLLISVSSAFPLTALDWYAAPGAKPDGAGTAANPWPLHVALQANTILPGDTLYLRGGYYVGPGFISTLTGTSNNYITVRSYPSEWAVITDGGNRRLLTDLSSAVPYSTDSDVTFAGTESMTPGNNLFVDGECVQLNRRLGSATNWAIIRGWNGTLPVSHAIDTPARVDADFLTQNGSYVIFRDFEVTSTLSSNRIVGATNTLGSALNLTRNGKGNKAVQLIIHNVGHPGIGFWNQGDGGEINGCVMWGIGMFDREGTWIRGTSVYAQNSTGSVYLKNNIVFRCATEGMQAYGTAAKTSGFRFINNITMMNANGFGIAVWNADVPMQDNRCWTNYHGLDGQIWGYTSVSNTGMSMLGNVLVKPPTLFLKLHTGNEVKWNTFLFDGRGQNNGMLALQYPQHALSNMTFEVDFNTYAVTNHSSDLFGLTTLEYPPGNGKRTFTQWQSQSGFDRNSTLSSAFPNDYLKVAVQPLDYDSNRWHICVINTTAATNAALNLSQLGFAADHRWKLRDAQNYSASVASGHGNRVIDLPLTLTNVAAISGLSNVVNKHTNVGEPGLFNAFILSRLPSISPPKPPSDLHILGE